MSDTPETDRQWEEWLNKLKMPIESFVDFTRRLERERNKARAIAKYWQEQFGHSDPEHEWQSFPWEDAK